MKILHAFADHGVESEALATYGDVTRASLTSARRSTIARTGALVARVTSTTPDRYAAHAGGYLSQNTALACGVEVPQNSREKFFADFGCLRGGSGTPGRDQTPARRRSPALL